MFERLVAYASVHSFDIVAGAALIAVAIWLEWFTMGRFWRAFFRRR